MKRRQSLRMAETRTLVVGDRLLRQVSPGRAFKPLGLLSFLIFAGLLSPVLSASSTTKITLDSSTCVSYFGGTWQSFGSSCEVQEGFDRNSFTIGSNVVVTVPSGPLFILP